jgi:PAS domain S-box-containing protein
VTASSVDPKAAHPPIPEAEETIEAIHRGKVDAIVVHGPGGPQIVMLEGADVPYRVLAERMSDGALVLGAGRNILYANRRLAELTGISAEKLIGNTFESLFAADGPQPRENVVTQARLKRQVGTLPVSVWMSPISMGGGSAMLVTLTDLSIFVRAEQIAIAERFARSILEQATNAVVVLGLDGRITHASWVAEQIAAQPPVGCAFSDAFPLDPQSSSHTGALERLSRKNLDLVLATKPFHGVEVKLRDPKLSARSFLLSAGPLLNEVKESVGAIVTLTEITERKRAEEQQTMLVAELNHRVKNILAVVQSIASQTLRTSPSLGAFNDAFTGRIHALGIAHDILTRTRWVGIGLGELLTAVLAPYRGADEARVTLAGPPVLLPARTVVPLSMAFHELATNASKYGALSEPMGRVEMKWNVIENTTPRVEMVWSEAGGPRIEADARRSGFGTTLIQRVIQSDLDGNVGLLFEPHGLRAVMTFPLKVLAEFDDLSGVSDQTS